MKASKSFTLFVLFTITICPNVFGETCYDKVKTDIYAYADGKELTVFKDVVYKEPIHHYLYDDSDNKTKEEIVGILHKDLCRKLFTQICNDNSAKLPTEDSKSCGTTKKPDNQLADVKLEIADTKQKISDTQFFDTCEEEAKATRRYTITCSNDDYKIEILYNLDNAKCPDAQEVRNGECVEKEKPNEEAPAQEATQPAAEEAAQEQTEAVQEEASAEAAQENSETSGSEPEERVLAENPDPEQDEDAATKHDSKQLEADVKQIMDAFNERLTKEGKQ